MNDDHKKAMLTRARIIRSAEKLARKNGFNNLTLRHIALDIGIKAGSLYYHFPSKDAIVRAVLENGIGPAIEAVNLAVGACGPDSSPLRRVEAALRVHLKYVVAKRFAGSLEGIRQLPKRLRQEHLAREREYALIFEGLLKELRDAGHLRDDVDQTVVRMLCLGALTWVSEWYKPSGPRSLDDIFETFMTMVTNGILKAPAAPDISTGPDQPGPQQAPAIVNRGDLALLHTATE